MERISFEINGKTFSVGPYEVSSDTTLLEYIRQEAQLRGTKYMCQEGGCGACIVVITAQDPITGLPKTFSVNSCLIQVTSCADWKIQTIESIGDRLKGYHPIQSTLAKYDGTQCGYCTPGWIMQMYSLLQSNTKLSAAEIENSFGSNICRCTGYRPILDAFKTFAARHSQSSNICEDIEEYNDCNNCALKANCSRSCSKYLDNGDWCVLEDVDKDNQIVETPLKDARKWFRVSDVEDVFKILNKEGYQSYMLVAGNTGKGAYPIFEYPKILINISGLQQLRVLYIDQNLVLGAGTTLTEAMDIFLKYSQKYEEFSYLTKLREHLDLVAHIPVRNLGSIAGNLILKHEHNEFPSDVYLLLETIGASLTLYDRFSKTEVVPMGEFLKTDMNGKIIVNVKLPPLSRDYLLATFKILPRAQNAHAQVNAGFLYKVDSKHTVLEARIVIGGLSAAFNRAYNTERHLIGKNLFSDTTLQNALRILDDELRADYIYAEPGPEFRKKLALGLFYKGILSLCPKQILDPRYATGAVDLRKTRPLSQGTQVYDTNPAVWPLNEPMQKVEALIQCSGEAKFADDLPAQPNEVFAAFVLSTVGVGVIEEINPAPALNTMGVIAFYSAKDIPGLNSFISLKTPLLLAHEELLCDGVVKFYNQPIGIIVAETRSIALRAAKLVVVTYKHVKLPVLSIREAQKDPIRLTLLNDKPAEDKGADIHKVVKGSENIYHQYHFHMETQTSISLPSDDGIEMICSTQWMDAVQEATSEALNMEKNRIDITVRRVGGSYGGKVTRANQIGVAANLVTYLLNRPCRFILDIETNMRAIGKRLPSSLDFEAAVDTKGVIQYLEYSITDDKGNVFSEDLLSSALDGLRNCYEDKRWHVKAFFVVTDSAANTWTRAPGTLETIAMTEHIMEQLSYELDLDPVDVRYANFKPEDKSVKEVTDKILIDSDYKTRKSAVAEYNKNNRWKKRGLGFVPLNWPLTPIVSYHVLLNVFHGDGTVSIVHGGIEMGQGVNTKAIQVCAYTLGISADKVKVKAANTNCAPNCISTAASVTSESICLAVIKCCEQILERLAPIKANLQNPTWQTVVEEAFTAGINLQVNYSTSNDDNQSAYKVLGAAVAEVEFDVLTGDHHVLRVDLIEDAGQSLNPAIDVGQVEGAFIFGLGYWTHERLIYSKSGECETNRTWTYFVPSARDIPIDFRIQLRRNAFNPVGVLGSKATGEPATCLSVVVAFALRRAIAASRQDTGYKTKWFDIDGSYTHEKMILAAEVDIKEFKITS